MARSRPGDLNSSPANSRASSLRRSLRNESPVNTPPTSKAPTRRVRSSLALSTANTSDNDDEQLVGPTSRLEMTEVKKRGRGRPPLNRTSEVSSTTSNGDAGEVSGYSTPATSAATTPAEAIIKEDGTIVRRRGRPRISAPNPSLSTGISAFERAKKLRESSLSLNPFGSKRKRSSFCEEDEDDEDEAEDSDNTPDAQLARALQEEEDRKGNEMVIDDSTEEVTPRRTSRPLRPLRPAPRLSYHKADSDDELEVKPSSSKYVATQFAKRRQLGSDSILGAAHSSIPDSQDSDNFNESDDSDESEFDPGNNIQDAVIADTDEQDGSEDDPRSLRSLVKRLITPKVLVRLPRPSVRGTGRGPGRGRGGIAVGRVLGSIKNESSTSLSELSDVVLDPPSDSDSEVDSMVLGESSDDNDDDILLGGPGTGLPMQSSRRIRRALQTLEDRGLRRARQDRARLEQHHPELLTMWEDLKNAQTIKPEMAKQPTTISRELKPFQLEGLSWMKAMEKTQWGGGLLGDEMGMGKTIQAVSLIMSDYPAKNPSLVLIPPVALMQWQQEIGDYTDGTLKTFVFHGQNLKTKSITVNELKKFDVILMSYNSLESMFRHQEKGFRRKDAMHFEKSVIHQIKFHRVILDEAHNIKQRTTGVAKACFALKANHKWCLSGTPLQNRIGEFFSLVRFLNIRPFACYFCKQCPCSTLEWSMNPENRCTECNHSAMQHVSVFNQELLNPIQKHGSRGPGKVAFEKLRLLTDRFMLRRVKRDHSSAMELPAKEIYVDRQFFGEEENDFAGSIMNNGNRKFETYVAQGVLLNNYANIFGLIMQMRQVADHPDLILKKNGEGGQNVLVCCICDEVAEDAIRSTCKHDFCRQCVKTYLSSSDETGSERDCPRCHIPLSIDIEQPEMEQDEQMVKKSSIINRIKMENWTSSSKIEALVYDLYKLRSNKSSSKSIIFSQFTTMLQLVEWRLRRAGITTVMLDGSMTPSQRQASINHFMTDVNVECFLVSLKAGGVALNLTEASQVFIVDPWWNPAAEWQSADRCHRIGQCRPCSITRLCIEDSVESRMVLLQEKKANMINGTINADDAAMESLTPEDMSFLFRGT